VFISVNAQISDIHKQSIQVAAEGARNMFRMVLLTRSWNASHGGVYVPVTAQTQPNLYLQAPRRDITTTDGQQLTLVNPAYLTRLIAEMAKSDSGAVFRLTSLRPIRPQNTPDDWERAALSAFEKGSTEALSVEATPQGRMLRYMARSCCAGAGSSWAGKLPSWSPPGASWCKAKKWPHWAAWWRALPMRSTPLWAWPWARCPSTTRS
jgi:hypothetical protein